MKIAVNTRWLLPNKLEGFGWYSFHILSRLADKFPNATFVGLNDRSIESPLIEKINVEFTKVLPPARHPVLWTIWNQLSVPAALQKIKPDLYFSPDGFLPYRIKIPTLVTIHDLNFEEKANYINPRVEAYYRKHIRQSAKVASHIITVSKFSKSDIESRYNIDKNKVTRIYNGPQKDFIDLHQQQKSVQQRYALDHPYFLFVGAQNPRKNLHRIFQAFDGFKEKHATPHKLILVGEKMMWDDQIELAFKNMMHKDDVIFTGRLSEEELNRVYSAATALLYPSLYEGFGMPIIEAFASGTPVITSLSSAMPEVAGDAAVLIDPTRFEELVMAMDKIVFDDGVAQDLIAKGFERAKAFSWDDAADQTAHIIKSLLHA